MFVIILKLSSRIKAEDNDELEQNKQANDKKHNNNSQDQY
ncbi:protein of unknown function [Vibrio tapetis subsp. tapetis]|uniref:Uncharacterized protein n=1 Tax=Vibrio tapetis subsp. tapetis TaxID=1671868 RepID=A0A2N8ZFA8_9VIBR|nr:protein of unknown function [Vibrio tapetis subsp. tapetis]